MIKLTIDDRQVEVEPGQTVLAAARKLGLDIPTLCYLEECGPMSSCLACLVKVRLNGSSRMVPSCATAAETGMVIESETEEVHQARKTALELLLSDHVGDCLSPCHRICPLHLNIPVMIRHIEAGQLEQAAVTVRQALPLPAVLGRLCHHPCENGCRRGAHDQAAAIRDMERHVADHNQSRQEPVLPARKPPTGKSVVVVGAGPTGLAAADFLLREGHSVTLVDRNSDAGGSLRLIDPETLPKSVLQAEFAQLEMLGLRFRLGVELGCNLSIEDLEREFNAVLLTPGELLKGEAEPWGLAAAGQRLKVDSETGLTSRHGVFAAGSAVKPVKQIVRAVSEGCLAAKAINQFLAGGAIQRTEKQFSSMMGRLDESELRLFLIGPSLAPRVCPSRGIWEGFTCQEACGEAWRCLHCDCRAAGNCTLQHYADVYGADPNRFRTKRRLFEQYQQEGNVIFEPGKCILCGICVRITEQAREPLGLTFVGRGFDVRIGAPLSHTIAEGLGRVAAECVAKCPTGALVFRDRLVGGGSSHE